MLAKQIILGIIGLASGIIVAAGLLSFIVTLGVISDFADRTKTGNRINLYEDCIGVGGILGNIFYMYQIHLPLGNIFLAVFGLFVGIFVGAWIMALAEVLNVFPIFIRRVKLFRFIPYLVLSIALGKGIGSMIYFYLGW